MDYLNIDYNSTTGWSTVLMVVLLSVIALSAYQQGSIKELFRSRGDNRGVRAVSRSHSPVYAQSRQAHQDRGDRRRDDGNRGDRRRDDGNRGDRRRDDGNRGDAHWRWNQGDWQRYHPAPSRWNWGNWWPRWGWGSVDPCADVAATACEYSSNYPACYNNAYLNCANRGII